MILIAEKRKAGAQFQKELGYVLDESLFNISFDHIFLERNEIKDIRVFHRLHSQFALRSRKAIFKVADLIRNGLALIKPTFNLMNQNAVHKAQMRAFVKCVAINTGLGFDLWMDDADIENDVDDLSKHNLWAVKERMQQAYTRAIKKGMSTGDIAKAVNKTEDEVRILFTYFDALNRFEQELNAL